MKTNLSKTIELTGGVSATIMESATLAIKGPRGEIIRQFLHPKVHLKLENNNVYVQAEKATKREKKIVSSFAAHIRNMVKGAKEDYVYKLKVCSGHFPMNVSVAGKEIIIKNFLGESVPRRTTFPSGVEVKVEGNEITVKSPNKELAGLTAGKIEQLCVITNRDRRIFQDGCYITSKPGKAI